MKEVTMRYFAIFDDTGERITSIVEGVHFEIIENEIIPPIPSGFVEITEKEQNLYATNEYIRGAEGKPILRPKYMPTKEEVQKNKFKEINLAYSSKEEQLLKAISQAQARGDTATATKLNATFVANREAVS